jgi:hypothetical protein
MRLRRLGAVVATDPSALTVTLGDTGWLGQSQGRVSYIVNGKYQVTSINSLTRIADGLRMPGPARAALGLASGPAAQASAPPARALPDNQHHPVAGAQYPVTTQQAVTASIGLWHADAARSQDVLSAPLDPAAWNAAALAWLLSPPDSALPDANGHGREVGHADITRVRGGPQRRRDLRPGRRVPQAGRRE